MLLWRLALIRFSAVPVLLLSASFAEPAAIPRRPEPRFPSLDAIPVRPEELPEEFRFVQGIPTASTAPRAFFERESVQELLPPEQAARIPEETWEQVPPRRGKTYQALAARGGYPGTVFVVEYAAEPGPALEGFLRGYLWGEEGRPTEEHPDEFQVHGRFLFLFSFPRGDPAAEWFKERLRRKFRIPFLRIRPEFDDLGPRLTEAFRARDGKSGLALLDAHAERVESWAFGWHFRAAFALGERDWETAERAALRALALDASMEDPLPESLVWADVGAVGTARFEAGEVDGAVAAFLRARAFARERGLDRKETSRTDFDLARALARAERWGEALEALREAIAADPRWKGAARREGDFDAAREREEFAELLGE